MILRNKFIGFLPLLDETDSTIILTGEAMIGFGVTVYNSGLFSKKEPVADRRPFEIMGNIANGVGHVLAYKSNEDGNLGRICGRKIEWVNGQFKE